MLSGLTSPCLLSACRLEAPQTSPIGNPAVAVHEVRKVSPAGPWGHNDPRPPRPTPPGSSLMASPCRALPPYSANPSLYPPAGSRCGCINLAWPLWRALAPRNQPTFLTLHLPPRPHARMRESGRGAAVARKVPGSGVREFVIVSPPLGGCGAMLRNQGDAGTGREGRVRAARGSCALLSVCVQLGRICIQPRKPGRICHGKG